MSALLDFLQRTPLEQLLHWERSKGDEIYLTQPLPGGGTADFSWAQVADQARRGAAYLRSLDLPPRSNIVLLGKNSAHWIIADLAIWLAGHVSVPLYPTLGAESARYIFEHCGAKLLVVGKLDGVSDNWSQLEKAVPTDLPLLALPLAPPVRGMQWETVIADFAPLREVDLRGPEELATIIYTSGTTGKPKGVMHGFRAITAPCRCCYALWCPTEADRMLSYLPLAHIAERVGVEIPSLMFGFHLFFNDSLESFAADLKRARPTRFFSVPRLWTKFYQGVSARLPPKRQRLLFALPIVSGIVKKKILRELGLDQTRIGLTGAAPLPAATIAWYRSLGLELIEVFGMTENCATSHAARPGQVRPGYVGTPLAGVECRIDDNGEILVKSPGQMLGYYRNPEETAAGFTADGFFRTGDRGELDEAGRLRITGRVKELFKTSKGKYVAPVPIENRLGVHPRIEVICTTGPGQPQPFALAMLAPGSGADNGARQTLEQEFHQLLDSVNAALEEHERLAYLVVVKEPWTIEGGFLTPTMKLRRDVIEQRYLPHADHWRATHKKVIWE